MSMRSKTWNLRLNMDAFNAAMVEHASDAERLAWLSGLWKGMNCVKLRPSAPPAMEEGYALGLSMRQEAEAYRERMCLLGRVGAATNKRLRGGSLPPLPPLE